MVHLEISRLECECSLLELLKELVGCRVSGCDTDAQRYREGGRGEGERERERQTDRQTDRHTHTHTHTHKHTHTHTGRQAGRQAD